MTSNEFITWLKGYMDGSDPDHDNVLFTKIREKVEKIEDPALFKFPKITGPSVVGPNVVPLPHIERPGIDQPIQPYWIGDFPPFGGTTVSWTSNFTGKDKITGDTDEKMDQGSSSNH